MLARPRRPRSPLLLLLSLTACGVAGATADAAPRDDVLTEALDLVVDRYWRPSEVVLPELLAAGLQRLERAGDPVLVTCEPETGRCEITVGDERLPVDTGDAGDVATVVSRMRAAMGFVAMTLEPDQAEGEVPDLEVLALQGLLEPLDRHCRVIDESKLADFEARYRGTLVGIGARIGKRNDLLTVVKVYDDTPALEAGLRDDDLITAIDGVSTLNMSVSDAIDRIRGPEGVVVTLTIRRSGEEGRRVFPIVRRKVVLPTIEERLVEGRFALLALDHFSQKTAEEFERKLLLLDERAGGALDGVIIDLRGNKGGSMLHASRIVDYFVDEGEILQTQGKDGGPVERLRHRVEASPDDTIARDWPVVVLVDGATASGSEILAGGLKFLGRALVIGTQTFGKGTVQKPYELREQLQMKLTVARYLVAGGVWLTDVGITPDVQLGEVYVDDDGVRFPDQLVDPLAAGQPPHPTWRPTRDGLNARPELSLLYPYVTWEGDGYRNPTDGRTDEPDLHVALAMQILDAAKGTGRDDLLRAARAVVAAEAARQRPRLAAVMADQGIRWDGADARWMDLSAGREEADLQVMRGAPPADLEVELDGTTMAAGETAHLVLRVANRSGRARKHLRAVTMSELGRLDGLSFVIGDLDPDQRASSTVPVAVSARATTRLDDVRVYLIDDSGPLGGPVTFRVTTSGARPPHLALQVEGSVEEQADGGRMVTAAVRVRNDGATQTGRVRISFDNPGKEGVELQQSYREVPWMAPGGADRVELGVLFRESASPARMVLRARDVDYGVTTSVVLDLDPAAAPSTDGWVEAPTIELVGAAEPLTGRGSFALRARATDDEGVARVVVWQGWRDKLDVVEAADGALGVDVAVDVPLEGGSNTVRLIAVDDEGIRAERRFSILGQ